MNDPESAVAWAKDVAQLHQTPAKQLELVWFVAHHEYGTWLHLAAFDKKRAGKDGAKYDRAERYRFACMAEGGVQEIHNEPYCLPTTVRGICKTCTLLWRNLNGYGSEMDGSELDDLPFYRRKEQL